jgi:hypothetical protein
MTNGDAYIILVCTALLILPGAFLTACWWMEDRPLRRYLKAWRDARCAQSKHSWRTERILNGSRKPTGRVVVRCNNCQAAYTTTEKTNG